MAGDSGFPRRRSTAQGRPAKGFGAPAAAKRAVPDRAAVPEALDVARYVADMTTQLEAMAIAARLDLLAYFLGMAKAESEVIVRTSAPERAADAGDKPPDDNFPQASGFGEDDKSFD